MEKLEKLAELFRVYSSLILLGCNAVISSIYEKITWFILKYFSLYLNLLSFIIFCYLFFCCLRYEPFEYLYKKIMCWDLIKTLYTLGARYMINIELISHLFPNFRSCTTDNSTIARSYIQLLRPKGNWKSIE